MVVRDGYHLCSTHQEDPWNSHSPNKKVEGKTERVRGNISNLA